MDESTFSKLVRAQEVILTGRVTGVQGGFGDGGPGLLVQVRVSEWLKGDLGDASSAVVYFFYPRGEFSVDGVRVCAQARGWPSPPEVGARILVASWVVDPENPSLLWVESPAAPVAFESNGIMQATDEMRRLHEEFRVAEISDLEQLVLACASADWFASLDGLGLHDFVI